MGQAGQAWRQASCEWKDPLSKASTRGQACAHSQPPPCQPRSSTTDLNLFSSLLALSGFNFTSAAANLTSSGAAADGASANSSGGAGGGNGSGGAAAAVPMFSVFVPNNGAMRAFLSREGLTEAQLLGGTQQLRSLAAYHASMQPLAFADLGERWCRRLCSVWECGRSMA